MQHPHFNTRRTALALSIAAALAWGLAGCGGSGDDTPAPAPAPAPAAPAANAWMTPEVVAEQAAAATDAAREAVANRRAQLLLAAMTREQKMQQLTGAGPELLPELPGCFGARHVRGIAALNIPTFRITNGPVGLGQNDCVDPSVASGPNPFAAFTHPSSAKATALPSALAAAASFDPGVASAYGSLIGTEMNNLALHVFEAPGVNLARVPVLGRNFEYFGEDPFLTGTMAVAETRAVQAKGLIAMPKHFVANEQESNRQRVQETVDRQALRELYLLPFEMAVKDGKAAALMCAYNYVNGVSSCESKEMLTDVLRNDWGFTGYVQSDFFAMKSTAATLQAGMDHEMPLPQFWSPANITAALAAGSISMAMIDKALERRYTQMFKWGIFERPLRQTPIDFIAGGQVARDIGTRAAVLLQNNGALPIAATVRTLVVVGKASQVYAQQAVAGGALVGKPMGSGGGSSDVVPNYTVTPVDGLRNALAALGNTTASVKLVLVDDANATATVDGAAVSFAQALATAAAADAVVVMAGTISEEGADRMTAADGSSLSTTVPLAPGATAADGAGLDWYATASLSTPATATGTNAVKNSRTVAMVQALLAATSTTPRTMAQKTALVLKDNAGVSMDPALLGAAGPAILEAWFPGQEDGNIVADLLLGRRNPSGKLPVTFPVAGKGFLDRVSPQQFPGVVGADGVTQTVDYSEGLHIGYRWYDGNASGECAVVNGANPCVAFPFGHGLSYTTFSVAAPAVALNNATKAYDVKVRVSNTGTVAGSEVVQVYLALPAGAGASGLAQPPKRLVGFQKVTLAPGASQDVTVSINPAASNHPLSFWNKSYSQWITPAGAYTVYAGTSSAPRDLAVAGTFTR